MMNDPEKTSRGFGIIEFRDLYGAKCSMQESSLATSAAIWLGIADADPKILKPGEGWLPYPVPEEVLLTTRMHLNTEQAEELIIYLQHFVETGYLPDGKL